MMAAIDLIAWRALLGLSQAMAAEEIGCSLRQFQDYEGGTAIIPRMFELACAAVSLGIRRFPSQVYGREDEPVHPLDLPATAGLGLTAREREILAGMGIGRTPVIHAKSSRWFGRLFRLGIVAPVNAPTDDDPARQVWTITERGFWALGLKEGPDQLGRRRVLLMQRAAQRAAIETPSTGTAQEQPPK